MIDVQHDTAGPDSSGVTTGLRLSPAENQNQQISAWRYFFTSKGLFWKFVKVIFCPISVPLIKHETNERQSRAWLLQFFSCFLFVRQFFVQLVFLPNFLVVFKTFTLIVHIALFSVGRMDLNGFHYRSGRPMKYSVHTGCQTISCFHWTRTVCSMVSLIKVPNSFNTNLYPQHLLVRTPPDRRSNVNNQCHGNL